MVRDYEWEHFEKTGDITSYLCYKEYHKRNNSIKRLREGTAEGDNLYK